MSRKPWHACIMPLDGRLCRRVSNTVKHSSLIAAIKRELRDINCGRYMLEIYYEGELVQLTIER